MIDNSKDSTEDTQLSTGKYDPMTYWNAKARAAKGNTYDAVCGYGLSQIERRAMEKVQIETLHYLLPKDMWRSAKVL